MAPRNLDERHDIHTSTRTPLIYRCLPSPPLPWRLKNKNETRHATNSAESVYAGPGAGRYPTANSVVNDIVRLARLGAEGTPAPFPLERRWDLEPDFRACFYARVTAADGRGVLAAVGKLASEAGVSVHSVLRGDGGVGSGGEGGGVVDFVVKTDACQRSQVAAFVAGVKGEPWAKGEPVVMSIL